MQVNFGPISVLLHLYLVIFFRALALGAKLKLLGRIGELIRLLGRELKSSS